MYVYYYGVLFWISFSSLLYHFYCIDSKPQQFHHKFQSSIYCSIILCVRPPISTHYLQNKQSTMEFQKAISVRSFFFGALAVAPSHTVPVVSSTRKCRVACPRLSRRGSKPPFWSSRDDMPVLWNKQTSRMHTYTHTHSKTLYVSFKISLAHSLSLKGFHTIGQTAGALERIRRGTRGHIPPHGQFSLLFKTGEKRLGR
jgi:hypothetical protein